MINDLKPRWRRGSSRGIFSPLTPKGGINTIDRGQWSVRSGKWSKKNKKSYVYSWLIFSGVESGPEVSGVESGKRIEKVVPQFQVKMESKLIEAKRIKSIRAFVANISATN